MNCEALGRIVSGFRFHILSFISKSQAKNMNRETGVYVNDCHSSQSKPASCFVSSFPSFARQWIPYASTGLSIIYIRRPKAEILHGQKRRVICGTAVKKTYHRNSCGSIGTGNHCERQGGHSDGTKRAGVGCGEKRVWSATKVSRKSEVSCEALGTTAGLMLCPDTNSVIGYLQGEDYPGL